MFFKVRIFFLLVCCKMDVLGFCGEYGCCDCYYKGPYNILICGSDKDLVLAAFDFLTSNLDDNNFNKTCGKYEKENKEEGLFFANFMKCKNNEIYYEPKKAKVNLWAVVDKTNANKLPCKPDGIFFVFKDTEDISNVLDIFMLHNIVGDKAYPLPPIVFFCFQDTSDDYYNSDPYEEEYVPPTKDSNISKMKQYFIQFFESQYKNNPKKFIFYSCQGCHFFTGIIGQMSNLLERIM